ncbi:expressed unknown protein [Seminavis robusta]|uniref:Uncharacterized protein n=1 Tax=Seminavis robusta TaxID=568900 RepID=A0A9N8DUM2_9STRA|nr:expressed unknown protein [Seminavis robusta]|eukprot:Sro303_g112340.1 n/a (312) ;mRNA; r:736-1671
MPLPNASFPRQAALASNKEKSSVACSLTVHSSQSDWKEESLEVLQSLDTGDILLYRTKDLGATFNAVVQGSYYSHSSVVVRGKMTDLEPFFPEDYKIDKIDKNNDNDAICIFEVVPQRGVCLFPLEARLARTIDNLEYLSVRRHSGLITPSAYSNLLLFIREVLGRKLELLTLDMARSLFLHRLGKKYKQYAATQYLKNAKEDWTQFYCSELVAESLQQLHILREEGFHSNDLVPASFAMPPPDIAQLHPHSRRSFNFGEDEQITRPGHSYSEEQPLIVPEGNELQQALKLKKMQMKEQYKKQKLKQQQQH